MNRHIEEMANDLAKICPDLVENCCGQVNCVTHLTLSLSKMGYRKASEVAKEIFEKLAQKRNEYWNKGKYTMFECWCNAEEDVQKEHESEGADDE